MYFLLWVEFYVCRQYLPPFFEHVIRKCKEYPHSMFILLFLIAELIKVPVFWTLSKRRKRNQTPTDPKSETFTLFR